jgi:hypothetical protein
MWTIPVAANFFHGSNMLTLRLIAGPGYATDLSTELLKAVYSELIAEQAPTVPSEEAVFALEYCRHHDMRRVRASKGPKGKERECI